MHIEQDKVVSLRGDAAGAKSGCRGSAHAGI